MILAQILHYLDESIFRETASFPCLTRVDNVANLHYNTKIIMVILVNMVYYIYGKELAIFQLMLLSAKEVEFDM